MDLAPENGARRTWSGGRAASCCVGDGVPAVGCWRSVFLTLLNIHGRLRRLQAEVER
jgi:hypothetical protein